MEGHNYSQAWSDKEFNDMFDLYEEDSDDEGDDDDTIDESSRAEKVKEDKPPSGLDHDEFLKLVRRCAQI